MKTRFIISGMMFLTLSFFAQDHRYFQQMLSDFHSRYPEVQEKLIFFTSVLPQDQEIRNEWKKTQHTFVLARLKGGSKGFQLVLVFNREDKEKELALKEKFQGDGFLILGLDPSLFEKIKTIHNVLLTSSGEPVYMDVSGNGLFNLVQKQITR